MTQQPHLGIQRTIERPNRAPVVRTEELLCPCCGNLTRAEWQQERHEKPSYTQTHCEHKGCPGYFMTMDVPAFFEQFGATSHDSQNVSYLVKEAIK